MFVQVRSATRGLRRWRASAVAVLTLAIGIGATTGLYALVQVLLPDLPGVPDIGRLGRIYAASQALGVDRSPVALNEFDASLSKATTFSAIGAYADVDATIGTGLDVRPVIAGHASPGFFNAMAIAPAAGRTFTQADLGSSRPSVILSDALWKREFPDGRLDRATIVVDGVERAVVGVMPSQFSYGFVGVRADLWLPLGPATLAEPPIVAVFARLRDGVAWPAADAELRALSHGQWVWHAIAVQTDTRSRAGMTYAFTLGPALLVLLIACINVACLLLARGLERDKELSVRRAMGATRLGIVRLLLTESLLLALVSGLIGAGIAAVILRVLGTAFAAYQPDLMTRLTSGFGLLPWALAASALACLIFGAVPALRVSKRDVAAALKGVPPAHRVQIAGYGGRDVIVFAEVASAVGLIVWTAMIYTLFTQISAIRFAFPADHVVAMRVPALAAPDVAARVVAIPGVTRVAVSSGMLGGGSPVRVETQDARQAVLSRVTVGDGFLETLGVPLVRGRAFDATEQQGHAGVAILSESAARQLTAGGNAVGLRILAAGRQPLLVIGVCRDAIDYGALSQAGAFAPAEMYLPYDPMEQEAVVLAHTASDPHGALRAIAAAAPAVAGARSPRPVVLSEEIRLKDRNAGGGMVVVRVLAAFAGMTLLLAASGVFAVVHQSVAQRTREFGIRMAIGAAPRRVLGMVLARETKLIGIAIAVGLIFTMALTRALFEELVRLNTVVPSMWIGALALSAGIAVLAVTLATYRITRLEPATVLRRT